MVRDVGPRGAWLARRVAAAALTHRTLRIATDELRRLERSAADRNDGATRDRSTRAIATVGRIGAAMKKIGEVSLGIVTGVGGYLDISSLVSSAQAGAIFEFQLLWAAILGGVCAAFLCEQSGRLAAVSGRTVSDAIRERLGSSATDMELIHDVLDAQLLDSRGTKVGRVDSIVVVLDPARPPRVVAVECGPVPLAARVHPRVAKWLTDWLRRRGSVLASPYRIAWSALRRVDNDFIVEGVDARTIPIAAGERWTRTHVIDRLPGA